MMSRASCISEIKDGPAMSALDTALATIRDHRDKWLNATTPEEDDVTRFVLGSLIELQVRAVELSIIKGDTLFARLCAEQRHEMENAA